MRVSRNGLALMDAEGNAFGQGGAKVFYGEPFRRGRGRLRAGGQALERGLSGQIRVVIRESVGCGAEEKGWVDRSAFPVKNHIPSVSGPRGKGRKLFFSPIFFLNGFFSVLPFLIIGISAFCTASNVFSTRSQVRPGS